MAITIERHDGIYVARCLYEDRLALSRAGFTFNKTLKRWITADDAIAKTFYDYTVGDARVRLDNIERVKIELVEASFAEDYDGDLLCPEGRKYLPFQRAGIAYALGKKDCLIGDSPGLGKTIQALGIINNVVEAKKILIVVPASLKINWRKEAERWLMRGLTVDIARPKQKTIIDEEGTKKSARDYFWPDTDVIICNYEALGNYRDQIDGTAWDILICDEAHVLKNAKAAKCIQIFGGGAKGKERIKAIVAKKRVLLTGTPILNHPLDMFVMIEAFGIKEFGNYIRFIKRYCAAVMTPWGHWDTSGVDHLDEFQEILRSTFMIRRMKEDVLKDLPPKRRQVITLPQDGLSKTVKKEMTVFADNIKQLMILNGEKTEADYEDMSDEDLGLLIDTIHERTKDFDDVELTEYMATHFEAVAHAREEIGLAKLPMVIEYVKNLLESVDKCVILCIHKAVAAKIAEAFPGAVKFVGGMSDKEKDKAVEAFQYDPDCRLFVGNINAAGVGITLTAAWNLVMAELCFVPALLEQGEDRIHRIGQEDHALIHYLIVEGSLESRLIEIIMTKQEMINEALNRKRTS
jgi:SNF2 family DNA or RNA helicase